MGMLDDLVGGYRKGFKSCTLELPDCYQNYPAAFKYGWLNGRDDRIGRPRASYKVLMARYKIIEDNCK